MLIYHFMEDYNVKNEKMLTGGGGRGFGGHQGAPPFLPLTLPLQIIQKPFYDFLKAAFTSWPTESNLAFSQVLYSRTTSNQRFFSENSYPTTGVGCLAYVHPAVGRGASLARVGGAEASAGPDHREVVRLLPL